MNTPKLFLATNNEHKVREILQILREALGEVEVEIVRPADFPDHPEPEETGTTFEENALIKARYWAEVSGLPALADDSGLVVDALDGRPGVGSARYAATNDGRIERVLQEMEAIAEEERSARFVCVAALAEPGGGWAAQRGEVEGRITRQTRGVGGFGYDPIFELLEPPYVGKTMAELSADEKNGLSHRGRALRALAPEVARRLGAKDRE